MADRLGLPAAAVYARRRSSEVDLNPVIAHRQGLAAVDVKARLAPQFPRITTCGVCPDPPVTK